MTSSSWSMPTRRSGVLSACFTQSPRPSSEQSLVTPSVAADLVRPPRGDSTPEELTVARTYCVRTGSSLIRGVLTFQAFFPRGYRLPRRGRRARSAIASDPGSRAAAPCRKGLVRDHEQVAFHYRDPGRREAPLLMLRVRGSDTTVPRGPGEAYLTSWIRPGPMLPATGGVARRWWPLGTAAHARSGGHRAAHHGPWAARSSRCGRRGRSRLCRLRDGHSPINLPRGNVT